MVDVPQRYHAVVKWAAGVIGIPVAVVGAQINDESGFNGGCGEVSSAGAVGIAQFLPSTWSGLGCSGSPCNDNDAFKCYAKYMYQLVQQEHGNVRNALAAYNAGPGNLQAGYGYADTILAAAGQKPGLQAGGGTGKSGTGPISTTSAPGDCLWSVGAFGFSACIFTHSQARAIIGGTLLGVAGVVALPVVALVLVATVGHTRAGQAAGAAGGRSLEVAGGAAAVLGAPEAGAGIAAAGGRVRSASRRGGISSESASYARRAESRRQAAAQQAQRQQAAAARAQAKQSKASGGSSPGP